jgi:cytochrome oxidase Cu insertion factor (SCO1/SenC/PrrC family)
MQNTPLGLWLGMALCLAVGVVRAQADDAAHFQAMQLVYLAEAVEAPSISLTNVDGKAVSLQSFRGKIVLLNFWTTW